jgi:hypothetical protein
MSAGERIPRPVDVRAAFDEPGVYRYFADPDEIAVGQTSGSISTVQGFVATTVVMDARAAFRDAVANLSLSPRAVRDLGTHATASELVTKRRAVFEECWPL